MTFVAHYLVTAASLDQQIEAWLLNPLLMVLLLMMLILALLEMPLFYAGLLLVFVALTLRKRSASLLRAAGPKEPPGIERKDKLGNRWVHFVGPLASFNCFWGRRRDL